MTAKTPLQYITSPQKLERLLTQHDNKPVATNAKVVAIHFQFAKDEDANTSIDQVVAIAIGNDSPTSVAVVLQIESLNAKQVIAGLRTLMKDPAVVKVIRDVDRVARWLHRYGMDGVVLVNCMDLQLLVGLQGARTTMQALSKVHDKKVSDLEQRMAEFNAKLKPLAWTKSPLAPPMLSALVEWMQICARCYSAVVGIPDAVTLLPRIYSATSLRWSNMVAKLVASSSSTSVSNSLAPRASLSSRKAKDSQLQAPRSSSAILPATRTQVTPQSPVDAIKFISSDVELQHHLRSNNNMLVKGALPVVGVHFQFARENVSDLKQDDDDQLVAIGIVGTNVVDTAVVLQLDSLDLALVLSAMRTLLSVSSTIKVMHKVHRAAFWLHCKGLADVHLRNCIDLQIVYENVMNTAELDASMVQIVGFCNSANPSLSLAQTTQSFKSKVKTEPNEWEHKPLPISLQRIVTNSAQLYGQCYIELKNMNTTTTACAVTTNVRWQYAIHNKGRQAIWFDLSADKQPRSVEHFTSSHDLHTKIVPLPTDIPSLELQCELDPLLHLLPIDYQHAILNIHDHHTKLVDVCLDVGRIPYVYVGKKQRVVLNKNGATVSKDIIDQILSNLGGEGRIGSDNRAGIDRQLHRISVMRSKTDEIYGLTMRIGRALCNAACVLTDLLLSERHADKSVLVLGHPGCGKTTLIRDVARYVSETMENVCIIDTSNEIGGDGLVPHACVGWARRMMVRSLEAQAGVMVECVQNHTVETLIVDEIGRKAEVLAASTVRQRGPRLIASAHGDFRALIKNPSLKDLVGGSQQVTVGDAAAKLSNKSKVQTQRAGTPIFDVIVELDHVVRGRCRIIWDVAQAVDSVLEGNGYSFETRQWDASTLGVQVL